jgi:hypothetical protein
MNGSLECLTGATQVIRKSQKRDLARFIEKRCAWEYREAHRRFRKDLPHLITKCKMIKRGIFACIQGDGDTCRRVSLVCKTHKKRVRKGGEGTSNPVRIITL